MPDISRGYQEAASKQREQQWIDTLKKKYPVTINKEFLAEAFKRKQVESGNFFFAALFAVVVAGCSKMESGKTPVARLDNKTLALEGIRAHIDTSIEPSPAQIQDSIQRGSRRNRFIVRR